MTKIAVIGFDADDSLSQPSLLCQKNPPKPIAGYARYGWAMMVGNAQKSDIGPVWSAQAWAMHIPAPHEYTTERAMPPKVPRFRRLATIRDLPKLVDELEKGQP